MKPWEETWTVDERDDIVTKNPGGEPEFVGRLMEPSDTKLAAAAPEMARLILEKEYVEEGYVLHPCCPWCGMSKACDREVWPNGHKNEGDVGGGCPLVAVLRKAGVME